MVKQAFSTLLAEISESYQTLRTANVALEAEVARLRGNSLQRSPSSASWTDVAECALEKEKPRHLSLTSFDTVAGVLEDCAQHGYISQASPNAKNLSILHRARTRELTPVDKDRRLNINMLPKAPTFTLLDAPLDVPSSRNEPSALEQTPTPASTFTSGITSKYTDLSTRVKEVSETLEGKAKSTHNFGMFWEGEMGKTRTSVISTLKRTKVIANGRTHEPFDIFSGIVIITYVFFLGFETEVLSRGLKDFNSAFHVLHMIYNSYFLLELIFRLWCYGRQFFTGSGWRINLLDALLVATAALDVGMGSDSSSSARMLRSIRVVRLVRTVRIVRAMRDVREFQKMVFAITSSLKTLAYSIVILFFILYFFAVIFTYGAMEARDYFQLSPQIDHDDNMVHELELYWGTFFKAIYSCYLSVSAGQSWYYVVTPLSEYSQVLTLCFVSFIALTVFGVLNAITSIFVESSLMSAQHYKDLIILDKAHEKELALNHIRAVFRQIDQDGSGEISAAELDYFLANDALSKYMEALNITTEDTRMLFRLLDLDESGVIDFEEFCAGCMRLKGEARAFDVHVMLLQLRHFVEQWSRFTCFVAEELGIVGEIASAVDTIKRSQNGSLSDAFQRPSSRTKTMGSNGEDSVKDDISIVALSTDNSGGVTSIREQRRRAFQV